MSGNLDNILSKVRGLVAKAEHPDTPEAEAELCRQKADAMMLKYAIDQATVNASIPQDQRVKPGKITIILCECGNPFEMNFVLLVATICQHTRTKCIFSGANAPAETINYYRERNYPGLEVQAKVYGFESDLKYFEILYTTLLLHMSRGINPKFDRSVPDGENAYFLHHAGMNWGQIAKMVYPWHEYGWDGRDCASRGMSYPGQYWRKEYMKYARANDLPKVALPAKFTDEARRVWRINFAKSYISRVDYRLWQMSENRQTGSELILASAMDEINKMVNESHPNVSNLDMNDATPFNKAAWDAGHDHANSADLGGQGVAGRAAGELS